DLRLVPVHELAVEPDFLGLGESHRRINISSRWAWRPIWNESPRKPPPRQPFRANGSRSRVGRPRLHAPDLGRGVLEALWLDLVRGGVLYSSGSVEARTPYLASPQGIAVPGLAVTTGHDQSVATKARVFRRQASASRPETTQVRSLTSEV